MRCWVSFLVALPVVFGALDRPFSVPTPPFVAVPASLRSILPGDFGHVLPSPPNASCPVLPLPVPLNASNLPKRIKDALQTAQQLVQDNIDPVTVPGAAIAIAYHGNILSSAGIGYADVKTKRKVDVKETLFRIASVTKVFPTLLAYQLAENGSVSLDDAIHKTVSNFSVKNPFGEDGAVSWRHLMEQRSGLQREAPPGDRSETVLEHLKSTYLVNAPGSRPSYSNLGFALLGNLLAEEVMHLSFSHALQQHITKPLGLKHTGVDYDPDILANLATGYDANGNPVPFYDLGWSSPAGQAYSTVEDLVTLAAELMRAAGSGEFPASFEPSEKTEKAAKIHQTAQQTAKIDQMTPKSTIFDQKTPKSTSFDQKTPKSTNFDPKTPKSATLHPHTPPTPSPSSPHASVGADNPLHLSHPLARRLLDIDYWNPDGTTLFGGPWEAATVGKYLALRKGGNLNGYASLLAMVPSLQLSVAVTWNGAMDEFKASLALLEPLTEAFDAALSELQPTPAAYPGPSPMDFVGTYNSSLGGEAQILFNATGNGQLIFAVKDFLSVFVAYVDDHTYRIFIDQGTFPCLQGELEALNGQYLVFQRDQKGNVISVAVPGFVPKVVWEKVK